MKINNYYEKNIISSHEVTKEGEKLLKKELKRLESNPDTALLDYQSARMKPVTTEQITQFCSVYNGRENHRKNELLKDEYYAYDFVAGIVAAKLGKLNHICVLQDAVDLLFYKKDITYDLYLPIPGAGLFNYYYWPLKLKKAYEEYRLKNLGRNNTFILFGREISTFMIKRLKLIINDKG